MRRRVVIDWENLLDLSRSVYLFSYHHLHILVLILFLDIEWSE